MRSGWITRLTVLGLVGACAQDSALSSAPAAEGGGAGSPELGYSQAVPVVYRTDAGPAADGDQDICPDGLARGTAARGGARRLARMTPSPEGVTVCPGGDVFVARDPSGEIWRVQANDAGEDVAQELWAVLGDRRPAGITCDERGRVFVATFATKSGKQGSLAPVMIAGKNSQPVELPQPVGAPLWRFLQKQLSVASKREASMHSTDILYPMFSLVALTFIVLLQIPITRFRAGFAGRVTANDFRLGESPEVPGDVRLPNRNYMNLLELPALFYVGCLGLYVTDRADAGMCTIAWVYVGLRVLHSLIHLTYNNVIHRLVAFALSNFVLAALWVRFFLVL